MKEIFDRHVERLAPEERRSIWWTISRPRPEAARPRLLWALSTAMALVAAAVITVAVVNREPASPPETAIPSVNPITVKIIAPEAGPPVRPAPPARHAATPARRDSTARVAAAPDAEERRAPSPPPAAASAGTGVVAGVVTDARYKPVANANVVVLGTRRGALSAEDGTYRIADLPPATYSLQVQALGHAKQTRTVEVVADGTASADVQLMSDLVVKRIEEIEVRAQKRIDTKSSTTTQHLSAERLKEVPVDNLREAVGTKAGVVARGGELHSRGGRGGEVRFQDIGVGVPQPMPGGGASLPTPAMRPPVIPTTGGTTLPNDEVYDSMFFRNYGVNPFIPTDEDSLSTFAVDVDAASYTVTRRYIELGHLPPADAVRVEEFVNFFPQGYPRFENDDFRILVDGAPSPFGRGYHLLRIGIKGREVERRDRKPAQLTFVIDVSGSMNRENRLALVKQALRLLVDQMRDDDRIGIVVYGTAGRVLLEPIALGERVALAGRHSDDPAEDDARGPRNGRRSILEAIDLLCAEGSTNAEQGLLLGYDMARRGFRPGAINRIVLCSDGVANVGRTGPQSILERVRTEADRGIHLSAIGFGMGNYNDLLMEQLANRGDGNYYYVDDLKEARRVFVENLTGTLQTIAKDAKVQVEFDPSRVLRYRLLGFENRDVADRDFRNDKVDAGEIGAGHEITALYEVKLAPRAGSGTIATVRLRYARPEFDGSGAPEVREISAALSPARLHRRFEDASPHFRLDAAVAEFAEILRGSYWARESRLADVLPVARSAARGLRAPEADEFVSLVEKAAPLGSSLKPEERNQQP